VRQVQQVVRTGGRIDKDRKVLATAVSQPEAALVKVGQRARAFVPDSKSSMFQARVTRVSPQGARSQVEVTLTGMGLADHENYVVEITVELGELLSVPNEAIIEEGDKRIVYVEESKGNYLPHEIVGGVQGELYTEIQKGLKAGDQVVTFGSFFVDSNYKLKFADQGIAGQ
jgi:Cu(I)/Ag(I) efflux system membrane fusion protein